MVACIDGWIGHVMGNVPALGKTMVFVSPGLKATPPELLSPLGAPFSAEKWPLVPMTKSCVPLLVKVTAWPAFIVTLVVPEKLDVDRGMVAAPLVPAVELLPPQAASSRRQAMTPSVGHQVTRARDAGGCGDAFAFAFDDSMRSSFELTVV